MALINFNELTEFALRLVNLYYHNTSLDVGFTPMSSSSETDESALASAIFAHSMGPEKTDSTTRSGHLGQWCECTGKPIAAQCGHSPDAAQRGTAGPFARLLRARAASPPSSAEYAGFPQTLPIFVCIGAIVGHKRPHHYFESP